MAKATLTPDQVKQVLARHRRGDKLAAIAADTGLKGHVVREVLRARVRGYASEERVERAKSMVALWLAQGTGDEDKIRAARERVVPDPGRQAKEEAE